MYRNEFWNIIKGVKSWWRTIYDSAGEFKQSEPVNQNHFESL